MIEKTKLAVVPWRHQKMVSAIKRLPDIQFLIKYRDQRVLLFSQKNFRKFIYALDLRQVIQGVLPVAAEYSNIIPIQFTNAQLAQVDEIAAQFKIKRSTPIREQLLSALSQSTEKTAS